MNQLLCTSHTFCCNPGRIPSPEFTVQEDICTSLAVGSLLLLATVWSSWGGMLLLACFCVHVSLKLPLLPITCFVWTTLVESGIRHSAQVQTSTLWCLSQDSKPSFFGRPAQRSLARKLGQNWLDQKWTSTGFLGKTCFRKLFCFYFFLKSTLDYITGSVEWQQKGEPSNHQTLDSKTLLV